VLTNSTNEIQTLTYTLTPYSFGVNGVDDNGTSDDCLGEPSSVEFFVSPIPIITNPSAITICSGESVNYTPESNVVGTSFTWAATNTIGSVTGFTASGSGPISDVLTNIGPADGVVTYVITPTGPAPTNCIGQSFSLEVAILNCNPLIGLAKNLSALENNGDGSWDVSYEFVVRNYGNVDLSAISVTDDLTTTFATPCAVEVVSLTSSNFSINVDYDGDTDINLLSTPPSGTTNTLDVGEEKNIQLTVRVDTCAISGIFNNTAIASGDDANGDTVTDDSQNGTDPDPDGDGDPTNDDSPTPVEFTEEPYLGLAKRLSSSPVNNGDGTYSFTFEFRVLNRGNVTIDNLSLTDDLEAVFGGDCSFSIAGITSEKFAVNSSYDGLTAGDTELLLPGNELKPHDVGAVLLDIVAGPCTGLGPFNNTATVSGQTPQGDPVSDVSQDGSEPDPAGTGDPQTQNDPTPFDFECSVVVDCPQAFQGNLSCQDDIPAAVNSLAGFNDRFGANAIQNFCTTGLVTVSAVDVTSGTGCAGAPLILTRTYTIDHPDIAAITCEVFYTVTDEELPVITEPPSDLVLECGDAGNAVAISAWEASLGGAAFTDNCDAFLTTSFTSGTVTATCGGTTTTLYTLTVTDDCGNGQQAFANLRLLDRQAPLITLPSVSNTVECSDNITAALNSWIGDASANDACNGAVSVTATLISSVTACDGTNTDETRTYRFQVSDGCGNIATATADFIIEDTTPPQITAPANLNLTCDQLEASGVSDGISAWLEGYSVTEACQAYTVTNDYNANAIADNSCGGTITVTWTVTDDCGATGTATADLIIADDDTGPAFVNCPVSDITVNVDSDVCASFVTFSTPIAQDCNSPVTVNQIANGSGGLIRSGQEFPLGTTEIVFQAEDNCGNTTNCTFNITVQDSQDPTIACPSNDVVVCVDAGGCDWTSTLNIAPTGADNCPDAAITYSITGATAAIGTGSASGEVFALGTSTVVYTVTADNNAEATCTFDVVVQDCTGPSIDACPAGLVVSAAISTCESEQTLTAPTVSDNCSTIGNITISYRVYNPDNSVTAVLPGSNLTYTFQNGVSTVEWIIEDEAGNTDVCYQQVTVNEVLPVVEAGTDAEICISDANYTLSGSASNTTSLLWTTSGTGTFDDATSLTAIYTPSDADLNDGQVQLTLTGANGCGATSDQMILGLWPEATADAGADATICEGESHPLSGASATGFASLSWSTDGTGSFSSTSSLNPVYTPSAADITAGTVTLTLTVNTVNGSSCPDIQNEMVLTITTEAEIAITNIEDAGCASSDGAVTITGSTAISLNGGTPVASPATFTGLAAGFYTAQTTGACPAEVSFVIDNTNSTLTASLVKQDVSCNSLSDGSATVAAIGGTAPYTYDLIGEGASNSTGVFNSLSAGDYSVLITDNEGCTFTVSFTITEPAVLSVSLADQINVACNGEETGSVLLSASGGTPGYSFSVLSSPPGSNEAVNNNIISNMVAGTYQIRVTDDNSCTADINVEITESPTLSLSLSSATDPICFDGNNGSIDVTLTGGVEPYLYSWSNGANVKDPTGLSAGTYILTVTDANNCQVISGNIILDNPSAPVLALNSTTNTACNASVGQVILEADTDGTITVDGDAQVVTANNPATFTGLSAGFYTALFEDANGCQAEVSFNITNDNSDLSASVFVSNVSCSGDSDGEVTVTATGGNAPYAYLLLGTASSNMTGEFAALSAGSYSVEVTDNIGCNYVVSFDVNEPGPILLSAAGTANVSCDAGTDGSVILIATGGTAGYTYTIVSEPAGGTDATVSGNTVSGMEAGAYTIRVTDANNCTADLEVTITAPDALDITTPAAVIAQPTCNGTEDASINITVAGGTAPYLYLWGNGSTDEDLSGLGAGTYNVTVTDANGCTITGGPYTITAPAAIVLSSPSITGADCAGGESGSVELGVESGGTAPYTYALSTGEANQTGSFTTLSAGGYTYTVTGANGCTGNGSFEVTDPSDLELAVTTEVDESCNEDNNGSASVTASGGTAPYTFAWSGTVTQAGTTANPNGVTGMAAGTYTVTVTDGQGCTAVQTIEIEQPLVLISELIASTGEACFGAGDGTALVNATGGTTPYTYAWPASAGSQTTAQATDLAPGMYTVTVTDANGCTSTSSVTISGPAAGLDITSTAAVITGASCNGGADGSIDVAITGGTAGYTYAWSSGDNVEDPTSLSAGTYNVTVTDANGCRVIGGPYVVGEPTEVTASAVVGSQPDCEGNTTGEATVIAGGGTPGYTYLWSDGQATATATGLSAGTYLVTVTDSNGCTGVTSVLLEDPTGVKASIIASTNISCNGGTDGTSTVGPVGGTAPYTYEWSDGQATATATNLGAGQYTVTVTDANGCEVVAYVLITEPTELISELIASTGEACFGAGDGTALVNATGGTTPYTYAWPASAASQTTAQATDLAPGMYVVTVTDANGCTSTSSVTISGPAAGLDITSTAAVITGASCNGSADGSIDVAIAGGTAGYTYAWSSGDNVEDPSSLSAGTYNVTVTDANGCRIIGGPYVVGEPTEVTASAVVGSQPDCEGGATGSATASGSGGTGPYTYLWSDGQTTAQATGLTAGTYLATVTDDNGCTGVTSVLLEDPTGIAAEVTSVTNVECHGEPTGSATVTGFGGTGSYTYLWSDNQTTATATGLSAGQYTVTVTEDGVAGCSVVAYIDITEPTELISEIIASTEESCFGAEDGTALVNATGGTTPYTYAWPASAGSQTAAQAAGLAQGTYVVTVTDANGCTSTSSVTISGPAAGLDITSTAAVIMDVTTLGGNDGSIDITVTNGTMPYVYSWSSGDNIEDPVSFSAGTYFVTVTDANACTIVGGPYEVGEPTEVPVIGVAKRVIADPVVSPNGGGFFRFTYEIRVQNIGDVTLSNVQVVDNLDDAFLPEALGYAVISITSEEFNINSDFNGELDTDMLVGTDVLEPGEDGAIYLTLDVSPGSTLGDVTGPYLNTATASGTTPAGETIEDDSDSGTDPAASNENAPGATLNGTDDPTPVSFTVTEGLGLAKRVITGPINNQDGTFTVGYEILVQNTGTGSIESLQVQDNLDETFLGAGAIGGSANGYSVISISSEEFVINDTYNGGINDNLLAAPGAFLAPGQQGVITLLLTVEPGTNLIGPYQNSAIVSGVTAIGNNISDVSDSGINPTGTNPDQPGDTGGADDPTPVDFEEDPLAGLAKRLVSVDNNGDGSYDITYELNIENFGDTRIFNIQVSDNLSNTFGDCDILEVNLTSGDFIVNPDFDGVSDLGLLVGTDILELQDKGEVLLTVTVAGCSTSGPFNNTASLNGTSPSGANVFDASENDSDPDPNGDGVPDEASPTPVTLDELPILGVSKRLSSGPSNNEDGSYDLSFELRVENFGDVSLGNLQVTEDIGTAFDAADSWEILSIESQEFTVNTNFNGTTDSNLLSGLDTLETGNEGAISISLRVVPGAQLTGYTNQVVALATSPGGTPVTDESVNGSDPDPGNDGSPEESSPTPVNFAESPVLGVTKRVSEGPALNFEGFFEITYEVKVFNLGNIVINNIQVMENLETVFLEAQSWTLLGLESEEFEIDTDYNGSDHITLLSGTDVLAPGNQGAIYIKVKVAPGGFDGPYFNRVAGTGVSPGGEEVEDTSTNGTDPDPGNDGPGNDDDPTPVNLECFVDISCSTVADTIFVENDQGWCQAAVNFAPVAILTCVQAPDSLIEFRLIGAGVDGFDANVWYTGQPSGLMFNVGLTEVQLRASVPSLPELGFSSVCSFFVQVSDKEDPEILCQDISALVGAGCSYTLTPNSIDAGTTDNCDDPGELTFELSLDNDTYLDELTFGSNDFINSPITVYMRVTDQAGNAAFCTSQVNLIDNTQPEISCPNDQIVYVDENFCSGVVPDIIGGVVPVDNCAVLDTLVQQPLAGTLFGSAHGDTFDVILTVIDVQGNIDTCSVTLTLQDTIAPVFINCPAPDVKVNTLPGMCAAFVNFSLPFAQDNCELIGVERLDTTGLNSGDMFLVGTTILEYEATDVAGNTTRCQRKIIVNDKAAPEAEGIGCPEDLVVFVDPSSCGAAVDGIGPAFADNCPDNLAIAYRVLDANGNTIDDGLGDASGLFFELGMSTVEYRAQDQPVLLISEVTHYVQAQVGGTGMLPDFITDGLPDGDFMEVTNLGPAAMNISSMVIERLYGGMVESMALPNGVVLESGEVLTIYFGAGTSSPENNFFVLPEGANLSPADPAAYAISHSGQVLDVAVLGNFNPIGLGSLAVVTPTDWIGQANSAQAGIVRTAIWDSNMATDFESAEVCSGTSIGYLNPQLQALPPNGGLTSLQAQLANVSSCSFTVVVEDNEFPRCGQESSALVFNNNNAGSLLVGQCVTREIEVTASGKVADVNISLSGTSTAFGNLNFHLISPSGTAVALAEAICGNHSGWDLTFDSDSLLSVVFSCSNLTSGGAFRPIESLEVFKTEEAEGTWILQIGHTGGLNPDAITLEHVDLEIRLQEPFEQPDLVLDNATGSCTAPYEWNHPVLYDNCSEGEILMTVFDEEGIVIHNELIPPSKWGASKSFNFPVGTSMVSYTLTDAAGNETNCDFMVTVLDVEPPVLTCPDDQLIQLSPGECEAIYSTVGLDIDENCSVDTVTFSPELGTLLPIGENQVFITVVDEAGNSASCSFNVTILEHVPASTTGMACHGSINLSLGPDCTREVVPEMILVGNDYACFDNYEVTLLTGPEPNAPILISSPFVTENEIGDTLVVKVCDTATGECCWGYVVVDFYHAPTFDCPADTIVSCIAPTLPSATGQPELTSCALGGASISFTDELEDFGDCADPRVVITRSWRVEDAFGNFTDCEQVITVAAFDLDSIVFPADMDGDINPALTCEEVSNDPSLTHPDNTGYPTLDGTDEVFGFNYCRAAYLYTDEIYDICEGSYEIVRTWKVRKTCGPVVPGVNPREHIQLIRVLDNSIPNLVCPDIQYVSTGSFSCRASYLVPPPDVQDGCSMEVNYTVSTSGGALSQLSDGTYVINDLPIGTHTVTYRVQDACGRRNTCEYALVVEDQAGPVAICDDELNVSIGGGGYGQVMAEDIDEGSWDACGISELKVRRAVFTDSLTCDSVPEYFTDWSDLVTFGCCDVGNYVRIELRVTDEAGNSNVCWQEILVEDQLNPYCQSPESVNLSCTDLPLDFPFNLDEAFASDPDGTSEKLNGIFGMPGGIDNCSISEVIELAPQSNLECKAGSILRRFRVVDAFGNESSNTCQQVITIESEHEYEIKWPADADAMCAVATPDTVETIALGCDLIAVSSSDEQFSASGDECYQIIRTWSVINWCQYDGESAPYLVGRDEDCNGVMGDEYIWMLARPDGKIYFDEDQDETSDNNVPGVNLCGISDDYYSFDDEQTGYYQYTQIVRVYDDIAPVVTFTSPDDFCSLDNEDCDANIIYNFSIEENCSPNDLTIKVFLDEFLGGALDELNGVLSGSYPDFTITVNDLPIGAHAFEVRISDGCGNTELAILPFQIVDCEVPAPICLNGIAVELMPADNDGDNIPDPGVAMAEVMVSDFVDVSAEGPDCSGPITYSINRIGELNDPNQSSLVLDCEDVGILVIEIWTYDAAGNSDLCETYIQVQDNMDICGGVGSPLTAGHIRTEENEPVQAVEVNLSGPSSTSMVTGADGAYWFNNLSTGQDYTITPQRDEDYLNGISTFDLILINKHILGIETLDSPYKRIAADINKSGSITALDLIQLRKLILSITTEFPSNTSWRFVEAEYVFPNPENPWQEIFPEVVNLNDLEPTGVTGVDFIAVKIGDVSGDANPNGFTTIDERNFNGVFQLKATDDVLEEGREYQIPFLAPQLKDVKGFQGTLEFDTDALDVIEVIPGIAKEGHFGLIRLNNGRIAMSWNHANGEGGGQFTGKQNKEGRHETYSFDASASPLFTLALRTRGRKVKLREVMWISDDITPREAYSTLGHLKDVTLDFETETRTLHQGYALEQNQPNPFRGETAILYQVPVEQIVTITISDLTGRLIRSYERYSVPGQNTLVLDRLKLTPGVYEYTMVAGDFIATRKMVVAD